MVFDGTEPYLLNDITPRAVCLADVGPALLQALVQGVAVQLANVTVLLVLLEWNTAHFKKCKQLLECQHLTLLRDNWWNFIMLNI
jgi:hypothetical protein